MTDIRHTIHEAWRIVRHRRWYFLFPFSIASAIALICSLWMPRSYEATTVIKREQDPVFASMMGTLWTEPYAQISKRMLADLRDEELIGEALDALRLPEGMTRGRDGDWTSASTAARERMTEEISKGVSIEALDSSSEREVYAIRMRMSDPSRLESILRAVRGEYLRQARGKTVTMLRDVLQFFRTETDRCREELGDLQRQMAAYELQYPGINPNQPDATRNEQATLLVERVGVGRRLDELRSQRMGIEAKLQRLKDSSREDGMDVDAVGLELGANPRYSALTDEIGALLREIAENKTLRGMTDQHPTIRQLRTRLGIRREELAVTPRMQTLASAAANSVLSIGDGRSGEMSVVSMMELEGSNLDGRIAVHESRLEAIAAELGRIGRGRTFAADRRHDYLKLEENAELVRTEMGSWQKNIGPIQHILLVEDKGRTVQFATVEDVRPVTRPFSPNATIVMLICIAIGAAVGALVALISELVDRSFRTVKQLKTTLGLPVIESIDEIVTEAARRRRLLKRFVMMPVATALCATAMLVSGTMAYMSLENPARYEHFKSSPLDAIVRGES